MNRPLRLALLIAWLAVSSLGLAHLWVTHPDAFPTLPKTFWMWVDTVYATRNAEDIADQEFLVAWSVSLAAFALLTALLLQAWMRWRSRR